MLQRIRGEVLRYERVITYWPTFGPSLEGAVCASLRATTAAVSRQCGLVPLAGVSTKRSSLQMLSCGAQGLWSLLCH